MNKKEEELKVAKFFIDWLNKEKEFDYKAISNNEENIKDEYVDVYAKSIKGSSPQLFLQVVNSEGKIKELEAYLINKKRKTGEDFISGGVFGLNHDFWISKRIKDKEAKYQPEVKKLLLLLIEKNIGPMYNEKYFTNIFLKYKNSDFKGIYMVHLPSSEKISSYVYKGQILAIKDMVN